MGKRSVKAGAAAAELRLGLFESPERSAPAAAVPSPLPVAETVSDPAAPKSDGKTARMAFVAFEDHCHHCTVCDMNGEARCLAGAELWGAYVKVRALFECQCGALFQTAASWRGHRC